MSYHCLEMSGVGQLEAFLRLRKQLHDFESRSQHQVCPGCLDGTVVGAICANSLWQQQDCNWGQGQRGHVGASCCQC